MAKNSIWAGKPIFDPTRYHTKTVPNRTLLICHLTGFLCSRHSGQKIARIVSTQQSCFLAFIKLVRVEMGSDQFWSYKKIVYYLQNLFRVCFDVRLIPVLCRMCSCQNVPFWKKKPSWFRPKWVVTGLEILKSCLKFVQNLFRVCFDMLVNSWQYVSKYSVKIGIGNRKIWAYESIKILLEAGAWLRSQYETFT